MLVSLTLHTWGCSFTGGCLSDSEWEVSLHSYCQLRSHVCSGPQNGSGRVVVATIFNHLLRPEVKQIKVNLKTARANKRKQKGNCEFLLRVSVTCFMKSSSAIHWWGFCYKWALLGFVYRKRRLSSRARREAWRCSNLRGHIALRVLSDTVTSNCDTEQQGTSINPRARIDDAIALRPADDVVALMERRLEISARLEPSYKN